MENNLKKLFSKIMLTHDEKSAMKRYLQAFVDIHPVRNHDMMRHTLQRSILQRFTLYTRTMPIILAIALLLGGGVSLGAQNSLPGDTLYPVKTNINERIRGALTFGEEDRANYEVALAARRLIEASKVAEDGEISDEVLSRIEANFGAHADRVEERIQKFSEKENFEAAADINTRFQNAIEVHEEILRKLAERQADDEDHLRDIANHLRIRLAQANRSATEIDVRVHETEPSRRSYAERLSEAALKAIETLERMINSRQAQMSESLQRGATSELEVAKRLFSDGQAAIANGNLADAIRFFQSAWKTANTTIIRLEAELDLFNDDNDSSGVDASGVDRAPILIKPTLKTSMKIDDGKMEIETEIEMHDDDSMDDDDFTGDILDTLLDNSGKGSIKIESENMEVRSE